VRKRRAARGSSAQVWTAARLIRFGARRFRAHRLAFGHGTLNARDEAAYLTLHALNLPLDPGAHCLSRPLSRSQVARVMALLERRILERRPAAYLTHEAWLGDFRFYTDERALVPRSFIAELLRENLAPWVRDPERIRNALDLCTGGGALGILLAHAFPRATIDAADISLDALAVARINARNYRLTRRIRLIRSDLFSALRGKRYDLIVSNPPYVRAAVMRRLPPEYRAEPAQALAGGKDGLDFVRKILRAARGHLTSGGLLVVEVGHNRRQVERDHPRTAFVWPETSAGDDCVFLLNRDQLPRPRRAMNRKAPSGRAHHRRRAGPSGRA
jgi:ribosomal protein L3 glutamine methyltransferase